MLVVIPFCRRDQHLANALLTWIAEMGNVNEHAALLVSDEGMDVSAELRLARSCFKEATSMQIDPCPTPWPFSQNHVWRRTVNYVDHHKLWPFLFLETDAVPLVETWLNDLAAAYEKAGKPFMGYLEKAETDGQHMNGVGVYGDIMRYAPTALSAPTPQCMEDVGGNHMAFDVAGAGEVVPQMHVTPLIQFQYKKETALLQDETLLWLNPDAVLFHTCKDIRLIQLLRARRGGAAASVPAKSGDGVNCVPSLTPPRRGLSCDLFIKTWEGDRVWHDYALRSARQFLTGVRSIVVDASEHKRGYLWQQVVKLNADQQTDADLILVTDSDTMFTAPVTPESYLRDGKTIWTYRSFAAATAKDGDGILAWKECMTKFLGIEPENEFMERHPEMIPRWLLSAFRMFCWQRHGCSVEDYVMGQESFSEWNVLGFYAWTYHREAFAWINTDKETLPLTVKQFWTGPHNQTLEQRHARAQRSVHEMEAILQDAPPMADEKRAAMLARLEKARAARTHGPRKKKRKKGKAAAA